MSKMNAQTQKRRLLIIARHKKLPDQTEIFPIWMISRARDKSLFCYDHLDIRRRQEAKQKRPDHF